MSNRRLTPIVLIVVGIFMVLAVSLSLLAREPTDTPFVVPLGTTAVSPNAAPASASTSTQPKITWSPTSTEVVLAPGETTFRDFTFISNLALQEGVIEPVPEIARLLSIQPNNFGTLPAEQQQSVHVSFAIAPGTALGPYSGTIHVRIGRLTLSQTLKVLVNVWQGIKLLSAHATVAIPPTWLVNATATQINAATPALQTLTTSEDAEVPQADFVVRSFSRAATVPLAQFASEFDNGWFNAYVSKMKIAVNGHNAIMYSDVTSGIPHQPLLSAFIDDPAHGQVVVVTMLQVSSGDIQATFQQIVSAIQFD